MIISLSSSRIANSLSVKKAADPSLRLRMADAERDRGRCRRAELDHIPASQFVVVVAHHRFPFLNSVARYSHDRHASAMIVQVGFWQDALT